MGTGGSKTDASPSQPPSKQPPPQQQQQTNPRPAPKQQTNQQPQVVKKRVVQNEKANSTDMAILELKLQRQNLKKTTDKYYNLSQQLIETAKNAMLQDPEKNRPNAIYLIKRSKQYEQQIEKTAAQLLNIETSINAIEDGVMQVQIMNALDQGAKQLDRINQELSRAGEVMENVREAVATQREIGDILGAPLLVDGGVVDGLDEDELEMELQKLMTGNSSGAVAAVKTTTAKNNDQNIINASNVDANQIVVPSHEIQKNVMDEVKVPAHKVEVGVEGAAETKNDDDQQEVKLGNDETDGRVAA